MRAKGHRSYQVLEIGVELVEGSLEREAHAQPGKRFSNQLFDCQGLYGMAPRDRV
jgi:hypothetical protein